MPVWRLTMSSACSTDSRVSSAPEKRVRPTSPASVMMPDVVTRGELFEDLLQSERFVAEQIVLPGGRDLRIEFADGDFAASDMINGPARRRQPQILISGAERDRPFDQRSADNALFSPVAGIESRAQHGDLHIAHLDNESFVRHLLDFEKALADKPHVPLVPAEITVVLQTALLIEGNAAAIGQLERRNAAARDEGQTFRQHGDRTAPIRRTVPRPAWRPSTHNAPYEWRAGAACRSWRDSEPAAIRRCNFRNSRSGSMLRVVVTRAFQ